MKKFIPLLLILGFLASCDLFAPPALHISSGSAVVDDTTAVFDAPEDFDLRLTVDRGMMPKSEQLDFAAAVEVTEPAASPNDGTLHGYADDEPKLTEIVEMLELDLAHAWAASVTASATGSGQMLGPVSADVEFNHIERAKGAPAEVSGYSASILAECDKGRGYRIKDEFWMTDYDDWYVIELTEATTLRLDRVTKLSASNLVALHSWVDGSGYTLLGTVGVGGSLSYDASPGKYYIQVYNSYESEIEPYAFNVTLE